ncbi:hypothetical protein IAR55_003587 [Kwoniella newhampshirensis]|uniref:Uncharacterized protein n=1 Tax=Kwoniella newhampshirensis TaxID=1651941 RepID=A0AAW0YX66_9TREE
MMKCYLFGIGSGMSVLLASASVVLCFVFPSFLHTVKRQGATAEVLERLHFFSEMNQMRTVFRVMYAVAFLILSVDGFTKEKKVNTNPFWADFIFLMGQIGLLSATCLSVVILLPRNMTSESLPPPNEENFHPMVPFKRPRPDGYSARQFLELGERLNVGHETMIAGLFSGGDGDRRDMDNNFEMSLTPPSDGKSDSQTHVDEVPFAAVADKSKEARRSEMPSLPEVISQFKSPFEMVKGNSGGPTQVYVTSHTIVEEAQMNGRGEGLTRIKSRDE